MKIIIQQLSDPVDRGWLRFLTPLQLSWISRELPAGKNQQKGFLIWGIQIHQESEEAEAAKCGVLVAKLVNNFLHDNGSSLILSVVSIAFASPKLARLLGPALLRHALTFSANEGCAGVHISCPESGQYGDFVRELMSSDGSWIQKPGKVVVRLSNIHKFGPVLSRLEQAVQRKQVYAQWRIESYDPSYSECWKERLAFSKANNLGLPWDPDEASYDWEPSIQYSRVLISKNRIIGWLMCHLISEGTLRYGKLWVDPGWEHSGAPLALLCDVIRAAHFCKRPSFQDDQFVGYPIHSAYFISHPANRKLHRLVTNKFKPVCDSWIQMQNYYHLFDA